MIVDLCAFTGTWPSHPVPGDPERVRASLQAYGVDRIFLSPLEAAWCRNPHAYNGALYRRVGATDDLWPVPVLDPTVATWRAVRERRVRLVRLLPTYSPYALPDADDLLKALAGEGLGAIVQTRLEDPRRQHPLAQVPDLLAVEVADVAERHPELTVIAGGLRTAEIRGLKEYDRNLMFVILSSRGYFRPGP